MLSIGRKESLYMKYNFSSQFLKRTTADSNFGEAWESICYELLVAEFRDNTIMRLDPPDRGVDILHHAQSAAYQCKSSEQGLNGSIPGAESVNSLETAFQHRSGISWRQYIFATNANYTGDGYEKISEKAKELGIAAGDIVFHGPKYWSDLCEKHFEHVKHRLDYRLMVTEEQVIEAFRKARYYDKYVDEYREAIRNSQFKLVIRNNRTPIIFEIPFSPELTVENCLDAAQELLGISLDWTNYADLGTSAGPSLSLAIDRKSQGFSEKIKALNFNEEDGLQIWITIVWEDEERDEGRDSESVMHSLKYTYRYEPTMRDTLGYAQRKQQTIDRTEELLQAMMWEAAESLRNSI